MKSLIMPVVLLALPALAFAESPLSIVNSPSPTVDAPSSPTATTVTLDDYAPVPAPQSTITPFTSVPKTDDNQLTLIFTLPIWTPGLSGTIGGRGLSTHVDASFIDILNDTDSVLALGGRIDAAYGPWTFYASGLAMKLGVNDIGGPLGIAQLNVVNNLDLADIGLLYRIGDWYLGHSASSPTLRLDAGLGARYTHVGLKLTDPINHDRSQNQDWVDAVAAAQLTLDLDKNWRILFRGDVGGGESEYTWSAALYLTYRFHLSDKVRLDLSLGYGALGDNYSNGSGNERFIWDTIMSGPIFGIAVEF